MTTPPAASALIHTARQLEAEAKRLRDVAARIIAAERMPDELAARQVATRGAVATVALHSDMLETEAARLGLPEHLLRRWAATARGDTARCARDLRNREIARLARSGLTDAEIARRAGVSIRTVTRALHTARMAERRGL